MKPTKQAHVLELAKAFNVRLIISDQLLPEEACAIPHMRIVLASPVIEDTTYAVTLHELGHLVAPVGALNAPRTKAVLLAEEEAAWAWARHYALDWTPAMEAVAQWAEGTYKDIPEAPAAHTPPPTKPQPKKQEIDWTTWQRRTR